MKLCVFADGKCTACSAPQLNVRQICGSWRPGLGDLVAKGLGAIGITADRVEAVVGVPCGCHERQEKLNAVGSRLGIGSPPVAADLEIPSA